MKKLVQLSTSNNMGAIGKIVEQIGVKAKNELGVESWVIYGRYDNPSKLRCLKMGNVFEVVEHYAENKFLDNEGLASRFITRKIVAKLKEIEPDIIHLHNIHDHWINYRILFEYLNKSNIQVIWTFHDCWAFTGHCYHFTHVGCEKWKTECNNCTLRNRFWDRSKRNFRLKKEIFLECKNLYITTVSYWLKRVTVESFFKSKEVIAIPDGLDLNIFKPIDNFENIYNIPTDKKIVMGVATAWSEDKGLSDYYELASYLDDQYQIVLVGMTEKQISNLPSNIIGLPKTKTQEELSWVYNIADVVVSMSKAETFGLTIAEGLACGIPGIVYDNTALPELISDDTGIIVNNRDVRTFKNAIEIVCSKGKESYKDACRKRAIERFDKEKCFNKYLDLYKQVLPNNGK